MKKKYIFSLLIILFIVIRLSLILTSQYNLDGDRSIEGIMAKHVVEKSAHPTFIYGTHYGGSTSVTAHLSAIFFALFSFSPLYFKLISIILSLGFVITSFYFNLEEQL